MPRARDSSLILRFVARVQLKRLRGLQPGLEED
jgi:hypothetical protein